MSRSRTCYIWATALQSPRQYMLAHHGSPSKAVSVRVFESTVPNGHSGRVCWVATWWLAVWRVAQSTAGFIGGALGSALRYASEIEGLRVTAAWAYPLLTNWWWESDPERSANGTLRKTQVNAPWFQDENWAFFRCSQLTSHQPLIHSEVRVHSLPASPFYYARTRLQLWTL